MTTGRAIRYPPASRPFCSHAVEQVDPARLQESVWRAVALQAARDSMDAGADRERARPTPSLRMNIARYDRAAAAAVLAPAIAAFGTTDIDTHRQALSPWRLVLIDPLPGGRIGRGHAR